MSTHGGRHPACWAYKRIPDCRRFKSCPPDQTFKQAFCPLHMSSDATEIGPLFFFWVAGAVE